MPGATASVSTLLAAEGETATRIGRIGRRRDKPVAFAGKLDLDG